ncbi:tRNA pseudouridine(55) synthase TruB [Acaryochloris thomasi]|uniref:tRNA pseudouridine(55) synthase TruB n=1 Tax=Acaryochloris thomasi TaxID=2929456 RepID=UPI000DA66D03|nr:tRNA pseudouridine(55) synthase TruB [Acaryochloris thomasi]
MFGFLNLHKPAGMTSHDCIGKVRRLLSMKKVGHGGTLDPSATGVLPIALGRATRLLTYLPSDKVYRAVIRLGMTTTTDDLAGDVIETTEAGHITQAMLESALTHFQGPLQQIPPAYSAIQVDGKRLYDLARQGKPVPVKPRSVEVYDLKLLDWRPMGEWPEAEVEIACGAGTYIRSIARDLGVMLQVGGTLAQLSRTRSGGFSLVDSLTFAALETQLEQQQFRPIPPDVGLQILPTLTLTADLAQRFVWGQKLPIETHSGYLQVHHETEGFLGIGKYEDGHLKAKVVSAGATPTRNASNAEGTEG